MWLWGLSDRWKGLKRHLKLYFYIYLYIKIYIKIVLLLLLLSIKITGQKQYYLWILNIEFMSEDYVAVAPGGGIYGDELAWHGQR